MKVKWNILNVETKKNIDEEFYISKFPSQVYPSKYETHHKQDNLARNMKKRSSAEDFPDGAVDRICLLTQGTCVRSAPGISHML